MKVDNSVKSVVSVSKGASRPVNGASARPSSAPAGEQVALSSLSSRLQEVESAMGAAPAVDAERVSEIRQAIADGQFKINPERIADGLLDSVRQMLTAGR